MHSVAVQQGSWPYCMWRISVPCLRGEVVFYYVCAGLTVNRSTRGSSPAFLQIVAAMHSVAVQKGSWPYGMWRISVPCLEGRISSIIVGAGLTVNRSTEVPKGVLLVVKVRCSSPVWSRLYISWTTSTHYRTRIFRVLLFSSSSIT